jgi:predicted MFS family arabinose efflux permease
MYCSITGVATGLIFVSLLCLPSEQSTAGGLFQTALNIGNAFGTGMATLVYTSVAQQRISGSVANLESTTVHGGYTRDALLKGLKVGFWVSCGLALIGK